MSAPHYKINWFKILLYSSLLFLGYSLYRADYLEIPVVYSISQLCFSFAFLFAGFVVMSNCWRVVLREDEVASITLKEALVSSGLSIFTKYIPGKVLVVLGRASYIRNIYDVSMTKLSLTSLKVQVLSIWIGLIIGSFTIMKIEPGIYTVLLVVFFIISFSVLLYSSVFKKILFKLFYWITKTRVDYPLLQLRQTLRIIPMFILNWILWCTGFYFMVDALTLSPVPFAIGLGFALAATLAIVALIAPGGMGVREGLLAALLIGYGIDKTDAITISVASRLWFLIGEFFIFLMAITIRPFIERKPSNHSDTRD